MLGPAGRQNGRESHTGGDCSGVDGMGGGLRAQGQLAACFLATEGQDETSVGGSLRTARMGCVSAVGGLGRATAQGGSGFHDRRQANTKASNKCWALLRHRQGQGQGESGSDDRAWVGVQSVVSRRAPETRIIIVARRLLVLVAWLARWVLQYYYYRLTNHWTTDGRAR
jgi:hypothetical protein